MDSGYGYFKLLKEYAIQAQILWNYFLSLDNLYKGKYFCNSLHALEENIFFISAT